MEGIPVTNTHTWSDDEEEELCPECGEELDEDGLCPFGCIDPYEYDDEEGDERDYDP